MTKKIFISTLILICVMFVGIKLSEIRVEKKYYSNGSIKEKIIYNKGIVKKSVFYWANGNKESVDYYKNNKPYQRKYYTPNKEIKTDKGYTNYYMTKELNKDGSEGKVIEKVSDIKSRSLNVASWNIKNSGYPVPYFGTGGQRNSEIAQAIDIFFANDNKDVLFLQEVSDGSQKETNQYAYILNFNKNKKFESVHYPNNKNVILYNKNKFSIVKKGQIKIKEQYKKESRKLTWVILNDKVTHKKILFTNTHLSYNVIIQVKQLENVLDEIDKLKDKNKVDNVILGGDFNIETVDFNFGNNAKKKFGEHNYHCTNFNHTTKTINDYGEIDHICSYQNAKITDQILYSTPLDNSDKNKNNKDDTYEEIEKYVNQNKEGYDKEDLTNIYYTSDHNPIGANIYYTYK